MARSDTVVLGHARGGAIDFVVKPVGAERLEDLAAERVAVWMSSRTKIRRMRRRASGTLTFKDLASRSTEMGPVSFRSGRARGEIQHPDPDRGRIRRRQGGAGPRHPGLERPQGQALRHGELRCDPRESGGIDPVRPRERAPLTGATEKHVGKIRRGQRRHAVPSTRSANCRSMRRSSSCARSRGRGRSRSAARRACASISA